MSGEKAKPLLHMLWGGVKPHPPAHSSHILMVEEHEVRPTLKAVNLKVNVLSGWAAQLVEVFTKIFNLSLAEAAPVSWLAKGQSPETTCACIDARQRVSKHSVRVFQRHTRKRSTRSWPQLKRSLVALSRHWKIYTVLFALTNAHSVVTDPSHPQNLTWQRHKCVSVEEKLNTFWPHNNNNK